MRTKKEIVNKISEIYTLMKCNEFDIAKGIIYTDALCYALGEDYLTEVCCNYKLLYENKVSEVDTLYSILIRIKNDLSLLKLKNCPEEEFHKIPLEICDWIEKLDKIKKETGVKNGIH